MSETKIDAYDIVTETIIKALEDGVVPWRKPWASTGTLPLSMSTKKPYRGINTLLLALSGAQYSSPWWGTYKKISESGGDVRKGEKSTLVTFWKKLRITEQDENGEDVKRDIFMLRYYRVFNADQADWAEGRKPRNPVETVRTEHERIASADAIVDGYVTGPNGPALTIRESDQAFYVPTTDRITVPTIDQYQVQAEFYSTLFHELGHSTGHSSRCNRPGITEFGHFGDQNYSKEELVAEMTSAFLMAEAGLDVSSTLPNSAAYIGSWLRVLKGDRKLVVQAAAQAQRAAERVRNVEHTETTTDEAQVAKAA